MITQQNFWYFFGGTWLGVGAVLAAVGAGILWHDWTLERELARNGATVQGVVLAKSMTRRKDQEPTFRVEYRYTPAGGAVNEAASEVDGKTWDALVEGGALTVTYARDEPRAHRVTGQSSGGLFVGAVLAGLGGPLAITGAAILWGAFARRGLESLLQREGTRVTADVVGVAPTLSRRSGKPQWEIRYRYRDPLGRTHSGRSPPMPEEEARRWKPGDRGVVRYLRNRPRHSAWVGKDRGAS